MADEVGPESGVRPLSRLTRGGPPTEKVTETSGTTRRPSGLIGEEEPLTPKGDVTTVHTPTSTTRVAPTVISVPLRGKRIPTPDITGISSP